MAVRSAFDNLRREALVSMFGRLVGRLFSRKTTGLDGFVKRQLTKRTPTVEHDPELDRVEQEMRGRTGKLG